MEDKVRCLEDKVRCLVLVKVRWLESDEANYPCQVVANIVDKECNLQEHKLLKQAKVEVQGMDKGEEEEKERPLKSTN